jgi:hypothetical protein
MISAHSHPSEQIGTIDRQPPCNNPFFHGKAANIPRSNFYGSFIYWTIRKVYLISASTIFKEFWYHIIGIALPLGINRCTFMYISVKTDITGRTKMAGLRPQQQRQACLKKRDGAIYYFCERRRSLPSFPWHQVRASAYRTLLDTRR